MESGEIETNLRKSEGKMWGQRESKKDKEEEKEVVREETGINTDWKREKKDEA